MILNRPIQQKSLSVAKRQDKYLLLGVFCIISCSLMILLFGFSNIGEFLIRPESICLALTLLLFAFIKKVGQYSRYKIDLAILTVFFGFVVFNVLGVVNAYVTTALLPGIKVDIFLTSKYVLYGFSSAVLGLLISGAVLRRFYKSRNRSASSLFCWDVKRLRIIVWIAYFGVFASLIGFIFTGGFFLLLKEDAGLFYGPQIEVGGNPILSRIYHTGCFFTFIIAGLYLLLTKAKERLVLLIFIFVGFMLLLSGSRTYFFLPVMLIFFSYHFYVKKITFRDFVIYSAIFLLLFMLVGYMRAGPASASQMSYGHYIFYSLLGEFTSFSEVVFRFPEGMIFGRSLIARSAVLTALPQPIWSLFGVNKMSKLVAPGIEINGLLRVAQSHSGVRIGLIGQLFVDFGVLGMVVGMLIFGLILGIINHVFTRSDKGDARVFIYSFILSLMLYSIIGQSDVIFSHLYQGMFCFLILYFACRKKVAPEGLICLRFPEYQ